MIQNDINGAAPEAHPAKPDPSVDRLSSKLEKQGVSADGVIAVAKKHATRLGDIEKGNLGTIRRSVQASIRDAIRELRETHLEGMATAVVLTAAVLIANIQLGHIVSQMFPSRRVGMLAGAIIATPLLEELFKYFSIKQKATVGYFLTFNVQEFSAHVSMGVHPRLRIPAVIMHLVNTLVQKHYCMLAARSEEKDRARIETIGYLVAVVLHGMFNAIVIRNPGK